MLIKYIHLLVLVIWFGGMIFFSFIAAPSIFKVLPKESAGDVVGDIFPKYYSIGYISSLILLCTIYWIGRGHFGLVMVPFILMTIMTGLTFYSGLAIGPKARKIKAEIRQTSDAVQKEELTKAFKKIHAISMVLNISIIGLSLFYLAFVPFILHL